MRHAKPIISLFACLAFCLLAFFLFVCFCLFLPRCSRPVGWDITPLDNITPHRVMASHDSTPVDDYDFLFSSALIEFTRSLLGCPPTETFTPGRCSFPVVNYFSQPPPPDAPEKTKSEVEKRALRHSGLSSALGGGIESFTDVEMSTVGSVGGSFSPGPGNRSGGGGNGPSRVIEAKLRFSGQRGRGGGWAEVKVSDWGQGQEEEDDDGMEFDRIFGKCCRGSSLRLVCEAWNASVCVCPCVCFMV